MARKKKDVYHVGPLTEGKKSISAALMDDYEDEGRNPAYSDGMYNKGDI